MIGMAVQSIAVFPDQLESETLLIHAALDLDVGDFDFLEGCSFSFRMEGFKELCGNDTYCVSRSGFSIQRISEYRLLVEQF